MRESYAEFRLPPGHHGLTPEQVAENQRWRLLGAAAEVVAERGYLRATTADIARCAGVSRTTFYLYFEDLPGCLLAAYEMAADCVLELVSTACDAEGSWDARLRTAVDAVLEFFVAEPSLACLFGGELAAGVPQVAIARASVIERLSSRLAGGPAGSSTKLPDAAASHLVAGALSLVSDRIAAGEVESLPGLTPALVDVLAAPY